MRKAQVLVNHIAAGVLEELSDSTYRFSYLPDYQGAPVSLTLPTNNGVYEFHQFPPFFEGLLPEGVQLEALLRQCKLDKNDYFGQLIQVGHDLVGAVTLEAMDS
jgi:serine/threonine-protein kinase HipA